MRVRFADVEGVRTRYYEAGSGKPILLVHGGGAAADTWVRNIEALSARYRVLAPDLVGHGFTDAVDLAGKAPQAEQVRHLLAFLDHLGIEEVAVIGSSFGGLISALLYLARPGLVRALGLIGSSSVFHSADDLGPAAGDAYANQIRSLENPSLEALRARNTGSNYDKTDYFDEILLVQLTYMGLPDRKKAYEQLHFGLLEFAASEEYRVFHRLEDLKVPTLVITGREDPRAKWQKVSEGAQRIPQAEFHIIEKCGHKPFSEQTEIFNRLALDFLDRQYAAATLAAAQ